MEKVKQFIYAHTIAIIVVLMCVVVLQQCKSCVRSSRTTFNETTLNAQIDSLQRVVLERDGTIVELNDSLNVTAARLQGYERHAQMQNDVIDALRDDKRDLRRDLEQTKKQSQIDYE